MPDKSINRIFLSYCHKNYEHAAKIDKDLQKYGISINHDIRDVNLSSCLNEFMESLCDHEFVLVLLSEDYLKFSFCIFEFLEVSKEKNFWNKVILVKVGNIDISSVYVSYWNEILINRHIKSIGIDPDKNTDYIQETNKIEKLSSEIGHYISELGDNRYFKFDELINDYSSLLKILNISDKDIVLELLRINKIGNSEEQEIEFDKLRKNYPNNPTLLYNMGHMFLEQGKHRLAEYYIKMAISINPNIYYANYNLAVLYGDFIHNYDEAKKYYVAEIEFNPTFFYSYSKLAALLFRHFKDSEKAKYIWEKGSNLILIKILKCFRKNDLLF